MRVDVQKILFIGPQSIKKTFFKHCQKAGIVHFIEPKWFIKPQLTAAVERLTDALKIIRSHKTGPVPQLENGHDAEIVAANILHAKEEIINLSNKQKELIQELTQLEPFGIFSSSDLTNLTTRFWTGKTSAHLVEVHPQLISFGTLDGTEYFASFDLKFKGAEGLNALIVQKTPSELLEEYQLCQTAIEGLNGRIQDGLHYEDLLKKSLASALNEMRLHTAEQTANRALDETLFYAEGWVPVDKVAVAQKVASEFNIWVELLETESADHPPTVLENKGLPRVGEDLIRIFDTPSPTDKDPSIWVFGAFSLFFAMIVNDGGYGLLFLLLAIFLWKKYRPQQGLALRLIKLLSSLAVACILWGVAMHSFFSIPLEPNNPIRSSSFLTWLVNKKATYYIHSQDEWYQEAVTAHPQLKNATTPQEFLYSSYSVTPDNKAIYDTFADRAIFELALLVGSIHVLLGLLRYFFKNPLNIGWALFVIGGYCYIPGYMHSVSLLTYAFGISQASLTYVGTHLLILGPILSVLIALFQNGFKGIFECMTAVQIFADILSYLRIYALGLAGSIVAGLINSTATTIPLFLVPFLLVISHGVNILLAVMSGVIHGLRLNFLEWYHYSFEGGGKEYKPLTLEKLE